MDSGDRNRRLSAAVHGRYVVSAPPQVVDADLAILSAHVPRKQKRRTLFSWLGLGAFIGLPFVGCTQSTSNVGGAGPLLIGVVLGAVVGFVMFAIRGAKIDLRNDKVETTRALVRRIDLAGGQPLNVTANLTPHTRLAASQYTGPGMWTNASRQAVHADDWLTLEGRLSNGIAMHITRASSFGTSATRHSLTTTASTVTDTITLTYPPQLNVALPSHGPAIAQHIQRPMGATVEVLNQPGMLSVRLSQQSPDLNRPEPIAALLAQAIALVDRSRGYVRIDADAWPPYQPSEAEVAATKS